MKKYILFILIISIILSSGIALAQGKDLETEYPDVAGPAATPQDTTTSVSRYIQYIYYFFLGIAGAIGLIVLIAGGISYINSAGDPKKLAGARKMVLGAFGGLVLLLGSYVILNTINPELVTINLPDLEEVAFSPLGSKPPEAATPMVLAKAEAVLLEIKSSAQRVEDLSQDVQESINKCSCLNATALCKCTGGSESDTCEPQRCYAGRDSHPCNDFDEIKENLRLLAAWKDELLFYRNWIAAEIKDLEDELDIVLSDKLRYYQELRDRETSPTLITYLEGKVSDTQQEIALKEDLVNKLREVGNKPERDSDKETDFIKLLAPEIETLLPLPDRCVEDKLGEYGLGSDICEATCLKIPSTFIDKGECFDTLHGCQALACTGLNPCPFLEVNTQAEVIQMIVSSIKSSIDEAINIINSIRTLKTFYIET